MSQAGYTPIQLYYSTTAAAVPTAGNLANGELAINITDGKLYYKNNSGVVTLLAGAGGAGIAGGSNTQVQYNSSGNLAGSANMTFDGTSLTLANGASIQGLTVGRGAGAVSSNTAVGASALAANTTGSSNTAVGLSALAFNTTGTTNSALGLFALRSNTTGSNNTAIGEEALWQNTTASNNTAVGYQAGYSNTTGTGLVAIGYTAGYSHTTGGNNTAIGDRALYSNTSANSNTAVGTVALYTNSTGASNSALGVSALRLNTTGSYNSAFGQESLYSNTTASNNTAVGYQAAYNNTTGTHTVVGKGSLLNTTISTGNAILGYDCITSGSATTNVQYNTAIGNTSLQALQNGATYNTAVGYGSGSAITTGAKNTIIGAYNGNQGSLDIRTASNYVVLSDGDGNPRMYFDANGIANLRSSMLEQMTISATAATGTINFDAATQSVLYYTTNASGNFTMNIRGNSGTTLNNSMVTGQSLTVAFLCTNGSTAYYQSAMTIDGSAVTPKWQGGTAPTTGNASSIDSYVYTVIKTGAATFTVLASQTKFA